MECIRNVVSGLVVCLLVSACAHLGPPESTQKTNVISGLQSEFWNNVYDDGEFTIIGEEIHLISKQNWFLLSKDRYSDFVFEAEVLMPETKEYSNSGIIFRAQVGEHPEKGTYAYGYQAEVDPSARKWSGGLYDQGTKRQWLHPVHKKRSFHDEKFVKNFEPQWDDTKSNAYQHLSWNKYRVEARGDIIKIWVNGVLTTHVQDTTFQEGHIGIQHHGSASYRETGSNQYAVKFRNISITQL